MLSGRQGQPERQFFAGFPSRHHLNKPTFTLNEKVTDFTCSISGYFAGLARFSRRHPLMALPWGSRWKNGWGK
jgi:hypothetical protein